MGLIYRQVMHLCCIKKSLWGLDLFFVLIFSDVGIKEILCFLIYFIYSRAKYEVMYSGPYMIFFPGASKQKASTLNSIIAFL